MTWTQVYVLWGNWWLTTLLAALPIIVLFTLLAGLRVKPHWCAIAGASTAVCNFSWWPSASAHSLRVRPASARPSRLRAPS